MKQKIEYIDFAKGYAIFSIMCYHVLQQVSLPSMMKQAIIFGGTGVHLFFLLSGFGLMMSSVALSPIQFYKRRLSKIWLPYVLILSISCVVAYALHIFPNRFDAWVAGVGLYQMFSDEYIESFGGHFWFISAIIQLYLIFPVLLLCKKYLGGILPLFMMALAGSMLWWIWVYYSDRGHQRSWNSCFMQFLWEFVFGMMIAEYWKTEKGKVFFEKMGRYWWVSLPMGLVFMALMAWSVLRWGAIGKIFNDIPALLGYGLLSIFVYECCRRYFRVIKYFFLWVNEFSYSLYLVHILVLSVFILCLQKWFDQSFQLLYVPIYLILALSAGYFYEKISRKWVEWVNI